MIMENERNADNDQVHNVVILGGSYSGISIAHVLLKHTIPELSKHGRYDVTLVSASFEVFCRPAAPRAMISDTMFDQSKLFVSITKVFEQYPKEQFTLVHGTATSVDHGARTVTVDIVGSGERVIDFHALVIATGASTLSPLLGLTGDAKELREAWRQFREALKTAKSIVIAGGGPAGVETAGELGKYLNGHAGWSAARMENPKVKITIITSGKQILPMLRLDLAAKAERMLAKVGVDVVKGIRVEKVDPGDAGKESGLTSSAHITLSAGSMIEADLFVPATGLQPNTSFAPSALLTSDGRVNTNPATLRVDVAGSRIYAIGDCSSYARPAVHNIFDAVPVLGRTMKSDLLAFAEGQEQSHAAVDGKPFVADERETQLVPIGTKGGVGAMKGWKVPSWVVWLIKGRDYWLWTTPRLWTGKQWDNTA